MGTAKYAYAQLSILIKQIEAVLNSRPLVPSSGTPDYFNCLNPGRFLIGRLFTTLPLPELADRTPFDT